MTVPCTTEIFEKLGYFTGLLACKKKSYENKKKAPQLQSVIIKTLKEAHPTENN